MLKKFLIWGLIATVIFTLAFRPSYAVDVVRTLGEGLIAIGNWFSWA